MTDTCAHAGQSHSTLYRHGHISRAVTFDAWDQQLPSAQKAHGTTEKFMKPIRIATFYN